MHLVHIQQCSIQNGDVYIYVLNGALWDMEQVHCGICEIGLLCNRTMHTLCTFLFHNGASWAIGLMHCWIYEMGLFNTVWYMYFCSLLNSGITTMSRKRTGFPITHFFEKKSKNDSPNPNSDPNHSGENSQTESPDFTVTNDPKIDAPLSPININDTPKPIPKTAAVHVKKVTPEILEEIFPNTDLSKIHHKDICQPDCKFSNEEIKRQTEITKDRKKEKKFNHDWLTKPEAFCTLSGYWWAVFVKGLGTFCVLCRRHNAMNSRNKATTFAETPSVKMKSQAVKEHVQSKAHKQSHETDLIQKGSTFQKHLDDKESCRFRMIQIVMRNIYTAIKEEMANKKMKVLHLLSELNGVKELEFFKHSSCRVQSEMIQAIGDATRQTFLCDAQMAPCFGLLVDDCTDIAVQEQMVCFIQFLRNGEISTKFLFTKNLLKDSPSADATTIKKAIDNGLSAHSLQTERFTSLCSDGASVMVGEVNGLAGQLRREHPALLTFHCVCHRLALATTDGLKDNELSYVNEVHRYLRQLWQLFENSPKKTALFMKTQAEASEIMVSTKGSKILSVKLKKACKTRWLSFESSVSSALRTLYPLLLCLKEMEHDSAAAGGLYKKMYNAKFVGALYMLSEILPILTVLSKTFQKGQLTFSHIKGNISYTIQQLEDMADSEEFLTKARDALQHGHLSDTNLQIAEGTATILKNLKKKYIKSLVTNIHARFDKCQDAFQACRVFSPESVPK